MPGYADTKKLIEDTLTGRPVGTYILPEDHQTFALSLLDYIHSVELIGASSLQGNALPDTVPVQPVGARVSYLATVPPGQTYTYTNFLDENGDAIQITSSANTVSMVTLLWNGSYWSATVTQVQLAVGYTNGYLFMGVATPTTNPGTPDQNVFYVATTVGTYTNFGGLAVADGEVAILKYNGSWSKEVTGAATKEELTRLELKSNELVQEKGFFVADGDGRVGMKYDENGLDAALLSDHFQQLIRSISNLGLQLGESATTAFAGNRGVALETDVQQLKNKQLATEVLEDGFFICDESFRVAFSVDSSGVHAINIMEYELVTK